MKSTHLLSIASVFILSPDFCILDSALLKFYEVTCVYLLCDASDDGCGGARLHIEDYQLANDFARHGWAMTFDLVRRHRLVPEEEAGRVRVILGALRLI